MKRCLGITVLLLAALAFAAAAAADDDHGKQGGQHGGKNHAAKHQAKKGVAGSSQSRTKRFTFSFANTDNGSCGIEWATLQEKRTFVVKEIGSGTFRLFRFDRGTFTTTGGTSPGACDTTGQHGHTVVSGITGRFGGYIVGMVTATSFNPNAACASIAVCATRSGFLATYFTNAQYSCDQNSTDCKFNFNYTAAKGQTLLFRHWQDKGKGAGTMLQEEFHGDIATA
jgi:hypothetical protein